MLLASIAEIVGIGLVLPFLGVLTAPVRVFEHPVAKPYIQALNFHSADELLLPLTIGFAIATLISGVLRLLLLWVNTRLSYAVGADLSISIYRRTLYQPFAVHISRNSSEVINGIQGKTGAVISAISMIITLVSSMIMLSAILVALLSIDPWIALTAFFGFGLTYFIIIAAARNRQISNSKIIARESNHTLKALQEGMGGIRDVLIDGSQAAYCQIYQNADAPLRRAYASSAFLSASPRYAMEAVGMILIAVLAYTLAQQSDGVSGAIPILGTLALGAQRLLPILQQAYAAVSNMQARQASLQDAIELLDQPLPDFVGKVAVEPMSFRDGFALRNLAFQYGPQHPWVLDGVNIEITKGARIGVMGTTGSGKSTLLDIVMGLLQPTRGALEVDGQEVTIGNLRSWQAHIAHVPQAIFLADCSIEENIAFGVPHENIDRDRVRQAAQQAQIADVIETWRMKYETSVGERGIRLSGGQRQRIGIARALYKQADVIIFDEATSALDNDTERGVMDTIRGLGEDVTILIIAHRLSTLKKCTWILELGNGGLLRQGSYEELIGRQNAQS